MRTMLIALAAALSVSQAFADEEARPDCGAFVAAIDSQEQERTAPFIGETATMRDLMGVDGSQLIARTYTRCMSEPDVVFGSALADAAVAMKIGS